MSHYAISHTIDSSLAVVGYCGYSLAALCPAPAAKLAITRHAGFKYTVFDEHSGRPLGHGADRTTALASARAVTASRSNAIASAGYDRPWIWAEKISLDRARMVARKTIKTSNAVDQ